MESSNNIVYLLGAGASYQAIPIIDQLGKEMKKLAERFYKGNSDLSQITSPTFYHGDEPHSQLLRFIYYFGRKSLEFGTIDTYAKSLFFRNEKKELQQLKNSLSSFFTLWSYYISEMPPIKGKPDVEENDDRNYQPIDKRLIGLMAALAEKDSDQKTIVKPNVTFITWNYDLQLERAFTLIAKNSTNWFDIPSAINFYDVRYSDNQAENKVRILHLNGFHGYTHKGREDADFNPEMMSYHIENVGSNFGDALNTMGLIFGGREKGHYTFEHSINFAWENNTRARLNIDAAKASLQNADTLIIVGYSFPPFNRAVDTELLKALKHNVKIYYQDPNPRTSVVKSITDIIKTNVWPISEPSELNQIFIPPVF